MLLDELHHSNLHSACTLQRSTPQPLPTTSSRTRYVANFTLNLHPFTNLPITGILPLVHLITPAPHNPPIKQAQRMHQYTRSWNTRPGKCTIQIPVQHHDTRHSNTHTRSHLGLLHNTPHKDITSNIYFSPLVTAQHTTCSNTRLGLLKMGIMMPETCWESVDNKHLTVASCWFSLSLHNMPIHVSSTMCSSSGGQKCIIQPLVSSHL